MGKHKGLTPSDYRQAAESGMTMREAADALGVSHQSVAHAARKFGIEFAAGKRGRPANIREQ